MMPDRKALNIFQDRLGYHFSNVEFLQRALTHASTGDANYERLEFLGDRVLGLVVADILYKTFPREKEGVLARRHSALACTETLSQIATGLDLSLIVKASEAERASGGVTHENLLADCMEAVIGAVFLDSDYGTCHGVITGLWGERIYTLSQPPLDPKTALQEWAQGHRLPIPTYEVITRDGPDHAPSFLIKVTVKGFDPVEAWGASRRAAEKEAASILYEKLMDLHV
jgi:ribonuclease-3